MYNTQIISTINGTAIERVSEYKYLGIWIDDKITFKYHVSNLVTKLRQKIGFFYRNKSSFPFHCRKKLIEATFMSVLDYGDILYRHASSTTLHPLDTIYHSALRFITGNSYNTHHCDLYSKVGWPSLSNRRDRHWNLFILKAITGLLPSYINLLVSFNAGLYHTRSKDWLTLQVPSVNSKLGKTSFSYCAPTTWNTLQNHLKLNSLLSLGQFKSLTTSYFTSNCSCF